MPFDVNGYLGSQVNEIKHDIMSEFNDLFEFIYDLNRLIQDFKRKFYIHKYNIQETLAACLFTKFHDSIQASIILIQYGLESDSQTILRAALETLIKLKCVCDDPQYGEEYLKTEKLNAKKFMNIVLQDQNKVFDTIKSEFSQNELDQLSAEIAAEGIEEITIAQLAKKCNLEELYDYVYRVLCNEVHTNPKSLKKYIIADNDNCIDSIDCLPKKNNVPTILLTIVIIVVKVLESTGKLFNLDTQEIKNMENKFKVILELYKTNVPG